MKEIRLLLDCDPGLDDAVALALAMASPELVVTGISTVAANAPIGVVTSNAEAVMDRLGCCCPLFQGAPRPLIIAADVVCAIGSLTNIAELIATGRRPQRLAVMGGALGRGNATAHAELNIWADPHAAEIVFASGIPI